MEEQPIISADTAETTARTQTAHSAAIVTTIKTITLIITDSEAIARIKTTSTREIIKTARHITIRLAETAVEDHSVAEVHLAEAEAAVEAEDSEAEGNTTI